MADGDGDGEISNGTKAMDKFEGEAEKVVQARPVNGRPSFTC
jgi:hypothetical protein